MNSNSILKNNILEKISLIPKEMLPELETYIDFIRYKKSIKQKKHNLKGIWKGKGFDKIDVEKEISKLRKKTSNKLDSLEF